MCKALSYLGWHFSSDGLKPSASKINAFQLAPRPENRQALQRFLGSLQYFKRAVCGSASHEKVLWDLTKKQREYEWLDEHTEAFEYLRDYLSSDAILTPFDHTNTNDLVLLVDSSSYGAGAMLAQTQDNGEERPCAFASTSFKAGAS